VFIGLPVFYFQADKRQDMAESEILLSRYHQGVLTLTLNRPKVNAFNVELIQALQAAFKHAERDEQAHCILLSGAGNVFSAGQDIQEFLQGGVSYRSHLLQTYNPLILQIRRLEKPVVAAINGPVSGAALGIALACDLRIASDQARFVVGFAGIGLAPDSAVSLLLPALIGLGRATEFTFSNQPITAEQALAWGLVNRVTAAGELEQTALTLAVGLARGPQRAFGYSKRAFNKAVLGNLEEVLDYEAHLQDVAGKGQEHHEAVAAFLEKRSPQFHETFGAGKFER
jgi:2-(1,2-epoxy-1,2-dihydrophenyl)acetyl-CoA isomerase